LPNLGLDTSRRAAVRPVDRGSKPGSTRFGRFAGCIHAPRHSPPKYRLHKGSGQAFIEILGKRHCCGVHGTDESHAEYQRMIEVWRTGAAAAGVADGKLPADVTIGELCGPFWEHADYFYNIERKHSALGYFTPNQFELTISSQNEAHL
jgi:transposase InsO family protein